MSSVVLLRVAGARGARRCSTLKATKRAGAYATPQSPADAPSVSVLAPALWQPLEAAETAAAGRRSCSPIRREEGASKIVGRKHQSQVCRGSQPLSPPPPNPDPTFVSLHLEWEHWPTRGTGDAGNRQAVAGHSPHHCNQMYPAWLGCFRPICISNRSQSEPNRRKTAVPCSRRRGSSRTWACTRATARSRRP